MWREGCALLSFWLLSVSDAVDLYTANLAPLGGSGVYGRVLVFASTAAGGKLHIFGSTHGLSPTGGPSCQQGTANSCGVHVHSGASCADATAPGGHFYASSLGADPWSAVRFGSTAASGNMTWASVVDIGSAGVMGGRTFVVHSVTGVRVACGVLVAETFVYRATITPLASSGVSGSAVLHRTPDGHLFVVGSLTGLEASLASVSAGGTDCVATDACATRIHAGTGCASGATQGNAIALAPWSSTHVAQDWGAATYTSTTAAGAAELKFDVAGLPSGTSIAGRTFIVANNGGGRIACGTLVEAPTSGPTAAPTVAPTAVPTTAAPYVAEGAAARLLGPDATAVLILVAIGLSVLATVLVGVIACIVVYLIRRKCPGVLPCLRNKGRRAFDMKLGGVEDAGDRVLATKPKPPPPPGTKPKPPPPPGPPPPSA